MLSPLRSSYLQGYIFCKNNVGGWGTGMAAGEKQWKLRVEGKIKKKGKGEKE